MENRMASRNIQLCNFSIFYCKLIFSMGRHGTNYNNKLGSVGDCLHLVSVNQSLPKIRWVLSLRGRKYKRTSVKDVAKSREYERKKR